ncbi:MAG: hypothetical protein Q8R53_02985 [Nanoarchaeota archaeon]|nr:hypothetical protein [Nanoarchaeota archaeon]
MKKRILLEFLFLTSVLFLVAGCVEKAIPNEDLAAEEELESLLDDDLRADLASSEQAVAGQAYTGGAVACHRKLRVANTQIERLRTTLASQIIE